MMCYCDEKACDSDIDKDDLKTIYVSIDRIFYKVVNDHVEIVYDPFHPYVREVIEFFDTITYLGGKATASFMRGPMNLGDGKGSYRT